MAANDSNLFGDVLTSGSSELMGHLAAIAENSKKRDDALNNSTNILLRTTQALEKSLAFTGKDLNNAFKGLKSYEARLAQAELRLKGSRLDLEKVIKDLDEAIGSAEDESEKLLLQISKDEAELQLKKLNNLKGLNALQVEAVKSLQKTSINLMTNAANQIISVFTKGFTQAYSSMTSAYEASYGTITSYNSYSKADYNRILDDLQKFVKSNGLSESVSIASMTEEIKAVLQGGLTGELATTVAKYSVLAKEGGIAANFSDPDTLKLIKKLEQSGGDVDAFLENMMTQSKSVIETVGDSFGFANGQINVMMSSMYALANAASLSNKAIAETSTAMTAFNGVLGSTELDPTRIYEELIQFSETGVMSSSVGGILDLSAKYGSKDALNEALRAGNMDDVLMDVMSGIYDRYGTSGNNAELQSALHNVFGDSFDIKDWRSFQDKYKTKDEFEKAFRAAISSAERSSASEYYDKLSNYQTVEEAYQNKMENGVVDAIQIAQSTNVYVKQILDSIAGSVGGINIDSISSFIRMGSDLGAFKGMSSKFGDVVSSKQLFAEGYKFSDVASLSSKGSAVLGKGLQMAPGIGMIATGLTIAADTGIDAYNSAKNAGYSTGESIGYGAAGFATGHDFSLSNADKLKKIEETGHSFDWDEFWKATGAGAAVGAGVGTAVGGWAMGSGTVIGAGVGAATGAVVNATSQLVDMHEASELANSEFYNLSDTLTEFSSQLGNYASMVQEYSSKYSALQDKENKLKSDSNKLSKDEKINLEHQIKLEKIELEILAKKLDIEAKKLDQESVDALDSFKTSEDLLSAFNKLDKYYEVNKSSIDSISKDSGWMSINADITDAEAEAILKNGGLENDSTFFSIDSNGKKVYNKALISSIYLQGLSGNRSGTNWANNGSYSFESIQDGTIYNTAFDNYSTASSTLQTQVSTRKQLLSAQASLLSNSANFKKFRDDVELYFEALANQDSAFGTQSSKSEISDGALAFLTSLGADPSFAQNYINWVNSGNGTATGDYVGLYRVGIPNVPYDNFPALLHKGEKVMTATEVALEHAKGPQTTAMNNSLTSALESQTSVLAEILERIYSAIVASDTGFTKSSKDLDTSTSMYKLLGMSY